MDAEGDWLGRGQEDRRDPTVLTRWDNILLPNFEIVLLFQLSVLSVTFV